MFHGINHHHNHPYHLSNYLEEKEQRTSFHNRLTKDKRSGRHELFDPGTYAWVLLDSSRRTMGLPAPNRNQINYGNFGIWYEDLDLPRIKDPGARELFDPGTYAWVLLDSSDEQWVYPP
ncbi:hypothetical protein JTE90_008095 [Oedothorax gibbosus]|uniref:Uncharacterized protein n=1 Tax=Oedothorax gibbosus TaxID=931172 RepID=A0AAV6V198_9ARAC|nr:hypothetical protein JTE90_008095 [Oedothorax gibbosus]